jgi:C4-type Zn-finger protein
MGDSAGTDTKTKMNAFFKKLDAVISGEMANFTFILNDPAGNSYLQVSGRLILLLDLIQS